MASDIGFIHVAADLDNLHLLMHVAAKQQPFSQKPECSESVPTFSRSLVLGKEVIEISRPEGNFDFEVGPCPGRQHDDKLERWRLVRFN